ncbi:MAG: ROK family protein [Chitinophagaceae bacterium]
MSVPVSKKIAIGIDIGGTNSVFGFVDHRGNISYRGAISTKKYKDINEYLTALSEAIEPLIEQVGGKEYIQGVGIGAPNGNYYNGAIEYAPNLPWRGFIPLAELVQERLGLPAALTNDANAAAVGEMTYGAAIGMKHFIMITLGTGVGSGVVIDGKVVYGHDGFAGELGHTVIIPGGRRHWSTGAEGSLETYASATGVRLTALEFLEKNPEKNSLLRQYAPEDIDSKAIYDCAVQGDELANSVFDYTGKILGLALANFVMFSSPEAIVLFGGLMKAGDLITKPAKVAMEKHLLPIFQNKVRLLKSELKESDAAILGASALVWELK